MHGENGRGRPGRGERRVNLREVWRSARRRPWLSVGVPVALLIVTGLFLWWVAPTYEAAASVRVDEDRSGVAIIEALQTLSSGSTLSTEMEELRSRSLAEEVVDSLNLHVTIAKPRKVARSHLLSDVEAGRTAEDVTYVLTAAGDGTFRIGGDVARSDGVVRAGDVVALPGIRFVLAAGAAEHDRVVIEIEAFPDAVRRYLRASSVVRPNREADIILIGYEGGDRELVRAVPNLAARRFIRRRNNVRTQQARSTATFLEEQIGALDAQLGLAEDELREYREQYGVISLEAEGEAQVSRLAEMQAERELLEVERNSMAQVLRTIDEADPVTVGPSPYRALLGFPSLLSSPAASDLLASLHELEAARAAFLDRRTLDDPEVRVLTDQIRSIDRQLEVMATTYLEGTSAQIANLDRVLGGFTDQLQSIPEKELRLARLRRQTIVSEELFGDLQLRLKEAEIMAAVDDPSVRVVDPAILPRKPVSPDIPLTLVLALLTGMVAGAGAAVLREQLDDTVRTRDELQLLAGAPVLGSIPRIVTAAGVARNGGGRRARKAGHGHRVPVGLADDVAGSPVTEAYRSLRTNINFSQADRRPRIVVVTSPAPGDGKSTTAANLASTMAKQGVRCLLLDADLRRGHLHDVFGVGREPGLSNVLLDDSGLEAAVHSSEDGLHFVSTGTLPPNPAELLGSARMETLLKKAAATYEMIVIDAPPMNLVTDAAVLARFTDGVIVVARAGITPRDAIVYAFDQLSSVRARVLGTVLNDADIRREGYYGSYMQSYYGTLEE